jgi:tripeptidyl-peptidase-1
MFNAMFSPALVGKSPTLVSIAGGKISHQSIQETLLIKTSIIGVVQNTQTGFAYNGESDLDLEYAMNLVNLLGYVQKITLYQVGDLNRGISISSHLLVPRIHAIFFEGDPSTPCWMP